MDNKITYPNEFTYIEYVYKPKGGWFTNWNDKELEISGILKHLNAYHKKVKGLKLYIQNNILGNVFIYVNADHICVEANSSHTSTDGYRKKFVGKHITEIRDMFASIKEFNFYSGKTIQLKQQRHQIEISRTTTNNYINEIERKSGTTKAQLEVLTEKIKKFDSEIEELTKLIEVETKKEFPTI